MRGGGGALLAACACLLLCAICLCQAQPLTAEVQVAEYWAEPGWSQQLLLTVFRPTAALKYAVTGIAARVTDSDSGRRLDDSRQLSVYLLTFLDDAHSIACAPNAPFFGTGTGFNAIALPDAYALELTNNETLRFELYVFNRLSEPLRIRVAQSFEFFENATDGRFSRVDVWNVGITDCKQPGTFDVPMGLMKQDRYIRYMDFDNYVQGTLVWMQGHLHAGGLDVYLSNTQTMEIYFCASAVYDGDELVALNSGSPMVEVGPIGAKLRLTAVYDNSEEQKAAMALLVGFVHVQQLAAKREAGVEGDGNPNLWVDERTYGLSIVALAGFSVGLIAAAMALLLAVIWRILLKRKLDQRPSPFTANFAVH